MKRIIAAAFTLVLSLAAFVPAIAGHEESPGNSQFGKCKALTNGNGAQKFTNGEAFRDFDHIDDEDDSTDDFTEAFNYCTNYLSNYHPSDNAGGNGNPGNANPGNGNGRKP